MKKPKARGTQSRREFLLKTLEKSGQIVVASNATYVVSVIASKKGITAGAK